MNVKNRKQINKIVSNAKAHKDAFAVQELVELLRGLLEKARNQGKDLEDMTVQFVQQATESLAASPIYSDALVRELYRSVLDLAQEGGLSRELLLEELLFQRLQRPAEAERAKRRKQEDAKERILQAALDEFSDKGFHHTTIESIADRAGIAKGTVYRYFKTKEELFNSLKDHTIGQFVKLARNEIEAEQDVLRIIESIIRNYMSFFENNSAFFKVLMQEQKDFGKEMSEKFINELILALPGLKRRCWKASRDGHLKQMNYFTVFYGIIGFMNGVIQKWLHEGGEASLLDEVETIKEVLFYGFAISPTGANKSHHFRVVS
jgi:AcrR family transcriptional regulator